MNGLTVFQIKVHNKYSSEDFDEDLRQVLRRSGGQKRNVSFDFQKVPKISHCSYLRQCFEVGLYQISDSDIDRPDIA